MRIGPLLGVVAVVAFGGSDAAPRVAAAAPVACQSLAQLPLANGTVLSADAVPAGAFTPPGPGNASAAAVFTSLPAFCRVTLRLTPTPDSDIRVEVWLPVAGWNRKFQALGNGGLGGTIPYPALAAAVRSGYAAAGTDTGHVGGNADFVAGHPEKLVDFGYRAIHEMTVTAKAVAAAHYDARPVRSYFGSCSTGGRQALVEAQRYPEDFDGIVAGDASWDQMRLYAARVALNVFVNREPAAVIPPAKYPMIHQAVLNKCDAADGVKDGVIEDPARCAFDFATLSCVGDDRADCLTKPQVETAKAMASPIVDRQSGATLHPGRYYPGSELGWGGVGGPAPSGESLEGMTKIVFKPGWDYHTIRVPGDVERAVKADEGLLYAGDANLTRFFSRGGKLLMYHGWADPLVTPDASLIMYRRINEAVGAAAANALALFMVPGMGHCQGGPGTDVFDKIAALDQWVETGTRPRSIVASHVTAGVTDRTRPLCAYPASARYIGSGSTDEARNFRCEAPAQAAPSPQAVISGPVGPSPYDIVRGWHKPFSEPGFTFGGNSGVFAESPNRIFVAQRGEYKLPDPIPAGFAGFAGSIGVNVLSATAGRVWRNCLYTLDGDGRVKERWTQWDALCEGSSGPGPHRLRISPYDPEHRVWVINETFHTIYVFSNDGSKLLKTLGEKNVPGKDATHFARPQDVAFLPDGRILIADGLDNHRIMILDRAMNYLSEFGGFGKGPGQFNGIHALATGPGGLIFALDRSGGRINVFRTTADPAKVDFVDAFTGFSLPLDIIVNADSLWVTDLNPLRFTKLDFKGNHLYTWMVPKDLPDGYLEVHTFTVDSNGNLYGGDNQYGRTQKFVPKPGADPAQLVGPPWAAR